MADKKQPLKSPLGIASYPYLDRPDTKFDAAGKYKVSLIVSAEDPAAVKLIERIDAAFEDAIAATKGKKPKRQDPPYEAEVDDDGEETGNVIFKFASKASGTRKDGTAWTRSIPIFDSKKTKITGVGIWSGSKLYVSYTVGPNTVSGKLYISLYMEGVQVIELVTGSGADADSLGFDDVDDGYEAAEGDSADADSDRDSDGDEADF